jgi:hypothetical protein
MVVLYSFEHIQFFVDDGYSGTMFDRPAWTQLEDGGGKNAIKKPRDIYANTKETVKK